MSEHTPGPWDYGIRKDGTIWLTIGDPDKGPHYQGDFPGTEADARLVIAAPDLLEALRKFLEPYVCFSEAELEAILKARAAVDLAIGDAS
jgi:hypothetical protein